MYCPRLFVVNFLQSDVYLTLKYPSLLVLPLTWSVLRIHLKRTLFSISVNKKRSVKFENIRRRKVFDDCWHQVFSWPIHRVVTNPMLCQNTRRVPQKGRGRGNPNPMLWTIHTNLFVRRNPYHVISIKRPIALVVYYECVFSIASCWVY